MKKPSYSKRCERKFLSIIFLSVAVITLPLLLFLEKADYYTGLIMDSTFVIHLCHFLKTAVPSALNLLFLILTVAFILSVPAGFFRSIKLLFKGITYPSFIRPHLMDIKVNEGTIERVEGYEVIEIDSHMPVAFAGGVRDKKIVISSSLKKLLTGEELKSVLLHEAGHLKMNHPFKRLLVNSVMEALFLLPSRKKLWARFRELTELSADEFALESGADPSSLSRAIVKLARMEPSNVDPFPVARFSGSQVKTRVYAILGLPEEGKEKGHLRSIFGRDHLKSAAVIISTCLFIALPYINGFDNGYCVAGEKAMAGKVTSSQSFISICTDVECSKCDKCSPHHRHGTVHSAL